MSASFYTPPNHYNVMLYGAKGDGSTDDSAAIQAAINACASDGGGTVLFPRAVYYVGKTMQNAGQENSILTLPQINPTPSNPLRIALVGISPAYQGYWNNNGSATKADNVGPLLVTDYTGGSGAQSILAGYSSFVFGTHFTGVHLSIRDLCFRCPINPSLSALNLAGVLECDIDRVMVDIGGLSNVSFPWTQPTTAGATGIVFPTINNGAVVRAGQVTAAGYYYGFDFGEHFTGENVQAFACQYGAAIGDCYHSLHISRFGNFFSANGIKIIATGSATKPRITIDNYAIEQATAAASTNASPAGWPARDTPAGYDWDDASNYATGKVNYAVVRSSVGQSAGSWRINGGSGMTFVSLG